MSLRCHKQIIIERDTSQKHLKRDVFFVMSLRPLKYILKISLFFQKYLFESIWLFKNISQKRFRIFAYLFG